MANYSQEIIDLFSSINNVKVNKTVISEPDLLEFKIGKDQFQLTTDELSDATVFTKKYIKAKGTLLPAFTDLEWIGLIKELYKQAKYVTALEVSPVVLAGKLFIDHLNQLPSTTVAVKAYNILLEQDNIFYLRLGAVSAYLTRTNPNLELADFSRIMVELGIKLPGYKVLSYYDKIEGCSERTFWAFNLDRLPCPQ
jgi:hypothetical protein